MAIADSVLRKSPQQTRHSKKWDNAVEDCAVPTGRTQAEAGKTSHCGHVHAAPCGWNRGLGGRVRSHLKGHVHRADTLHVRLWAGDVFVHC